MLVLRSLSFSLVAGSVVACGGGTDNSVPAAAPTAAPTTTSTVAQGPAPAAGTGAGCELLRDRVTSFVTRSAAIKEASGENFAVMYNSLGDVLDKLDADLAVPFARADVGALAKDYRDAARATAKSAHEFGAHLSSVADLNRRTPAMLQRYVDSTKRVGNMCRPNPPADCRQAADVIVVLSDGPRTVAAFNDARKALTAIKATTPGLKTELVELNAAIGGLSETLRLASAADEGRPKAEAYERNAKQFSGLNVRGDQLCAR